MKVSELVFTESVERTFKEYLYDNNIAKAVFLCDQITKRDCFPLLRESNFPVIEIPSGEPYKNLQTVEAIINQLIDLEADRHTTLINLGGGMVCDIGGFVASIYMRGIPFIHIPTTLLSMVDAGIGGKTGIDHRYLKNFIGSFCHPNAIIISEEFLKTLKKAEIDSAWAEIIKTACIADKDLFDRIQINDSLHSIIKSCALAKQKIVSSDFMDVGERQLLNFGHTIGHAYESYRLEQEDPILHGFAVAKGILLETQCALHLGLIEASFANEINELIHIRTGTSPINNSEFFEMFKYLKSDKKNNDSNITFSLPVSKGKGRYGIKVVSEELKVWKNQGYI